MASNVAQQKRLYYPLTFLLFFSSWRRDCYPPSGHVLRRISIMSCPRFKVRYDKDVWLARKFDRQGSTGENWRKKDFEKTIETEDPRSVSTHVIDSDATNDSSSGILLQPQPDLTGGGQTWAVVQRPPQLRGHHKNSKKILPKETRIFLYFLEI